MSTQSDKVKLQERAAQIVKSNLQSPWSQSSEDELEVYEING